MRPHSIRADLSAVARRAKAERGVTLIEVTVMLVATLMIAGVLAPAVASVVRNARGAAALAYMNDINSALVAIFDDMQMKQFTYDGTNQSSKAVWLLVTDGDTPREVTDAGTMATWQTAVSNSPTTRYDFLERHLVTNNPNGSSSGYNQLGNPEAPARGWRGPYLNPPLSSDPWGNRYAINSEFLGPGSNNDVVVFSAGQDEIIETPFSADPLSAGGDDLIVLVES
jgi:Tfp pilus assembly protein PilE